VFRGAILAESHQSHEAWDDLCGFTPSWIQPWMLTLEACRPLFSDETLHALEGYDPVAEVAAAIDPAMVHGRHPLDKVQYTWSKTMLEGQILTWGGDRVDMANSMEARPAFLDHHLAELATTLSPSVRIKGRTEKWVLREAMKGLLPRVLYEREKFAFMAPPAHTDPEKWKAMQGLVDVHLTPDAIEEAGLLSKDGVAALFSLHDSPETTAATRNTLDAVFNHLIGVQVLHARFVAADIPSQARAKARELGWSAHGA
ncbi:MAG: asparagine synthase-related protein, partial [bacterium]